MPTFTPAIELPEIYDPYPDDLLVACLEVYKGISAMEIRRKIKAGSHKLLCKVKLQEKPGANQTPNESAEEICEIAMQVLQYDQLANADPAEYKITFYGSPNRSNGSRMHARATCSLGTRIAFQNLLTRSTKAACSRWRMVISGSFIR